MKAPAPPRSPWQLLYSGAHTLRRRWYLNRARALPRPVISIGNLHWGGTGKTPLTAAVSAHLRDRGLTVCILSRGYGGQGKGVRVVSTGGGPLLGPRVAGDEPVLLAGELPGVSVVVGPDRWQAGQQALRRLDPAPDLFVLDDGFSHLALRRDLDLVTLPAADPIAGGRLAPGGRLREPLAAVARASAVILTGADAGGTTLAEALRSYGFTGPGFASRTVPGRPRPIGARRGELPAGLSVFLVSAVARPASFTAAVRSLGYEIAGELRYPDHHAYPPSSLEQIAAAWKASGAATVLTTSKDRVKLLGRLDIPLAELPVQAEPEEAFWTWLDGEIDLLRRPPA
jgi:tetraacyldisaccharide 4'-kinase